MGTKTDTSMKKDVIITIASKQNFEGCEPDHINLITAGRLYRRNGKYFISYEESELTGMEGTRTTLKLEDRQVTMTRTGTHPAQMLFAEHKRHVGLYQTDVGSLAVSTHTSQQKLIRILPARTALKWRSHRPVRCSKKRATGGNFAFSPVSGAF